MSAANFKTENKTCRKLIGNGSTYHVPRFQRDCSCTDVQWEDLWADSLGTNKADGEPAHYMGYLGLQSQDEKSFNVIDGQQRLTTLTLIVLASLKNLKRLIEESNQSERNQQRMDQLRQTYIDYLDPVTLVSRSKLTLNRNNDSYFQTCLVSLWHMPQRGFRASEHTLRKAFEWLEKRVREHAKNRAKNTGEDEDVALATLVETMSNRVFFTVISVTDELNAFKVFETLNARGVRLFSTDLLKNYLFSVLHRENKRAHEMKVLEDRWEAMVTRLGSESFPDLLRVHWISRRTFVRQAELFKTVRATLSDREAVFELLRGMEEDTDTYLALTQPEASQWTADLKSHARELRMLSVRPPVPLIVGAHRVFNADNIPRRVLKLCTVGMTVLFSICKTCMTAKPFKQPSNNINVAN